MALGANQITTTTANVFRPNIWSNEVLDAVQSNLVIVPLVRHYDAEVASAGQTVEIPNVSNITANAKSANTQVTLNGPTETKTTITLNLHYESSFLVEDIVKAQSKYDLRSVYTKRAGYAIAEKMDTSLVDEMTVNFTQTVGAYGTVISDANVLSALRKLDDAKAPQTDRSFVISPQGKQEMLNIDKYIRYDAIGVGGDQNDILNGKIGEIYGVRVYMSQNVRVTAATPTQNNHLFFHQEAAAVAIQVQPRTQAQYKQEYLGWLVTVDCLLGVKVLRATFGVLFKS